MGAGDGWPELLLPSARSSGIHDWQTLPDWLHPWGFFGLGTQDLSGRMCLSRDNPTGNVSTSLTRGYDVVGDLRDDDDAHLPITPASVAAIPPYHVADWPEKPEVWNGGGALVGFDPLNFIHFGEIAALSPRCGIFCISPSQLAEGSMNASM